MKRRPPRFKRGELVFVVNVNTPHLCRIDRILKDRKSLRWKYTLQPLCWSREDELRLPTEEELNDFALEKVADYG